MEKTRCSGCMRIKKKAVCEHCGYDEKEKNDTHQLQIGTLLNEQYTVGRVLSQSGSDIQYLAWDNTLNSPVVIKEFFLGDIAKRGKLQEVCVKKEKYDVYLTLEKEQFVERNKAIAHFSSIPEMVHVRNRFQENNTEYIVTEYVRGITLMEYIRMHGPISLENTCELLRPVMKLLSQTHGVGLFHHNINPESILLLSDGGIKLLNFGSPPDFEKKDPKHKIRMSMLEFFVSPEQDNNEMLGPWNDIYSLCATIYFCLTGKVPQGKQSASSACYKVDWKRVKKKVYPYQLKILQYGMDKNLKNRPLSVGILYQELLGYSMLQPNSDPEATIIISKNHPTSESLCGISTYWSKNWTSPPKRFPIYPVMVSVVLLLVICMIGCFFTYHIWTEPDCVSASKCKICKKEGTMQALGHDWMAATCTKPMICKRCSETSGEALGHTWKVATCDTPQICSICNKQNGAPYGHDWQDASYDKPKTCKRCGLTEGNVKGYVGKVTGTWSDERFYFGDTSSNIYELDTLIENCRKFVLSLGVSNVQFGSVYGTWGIYGRNSYGGWDELGNFELMEDETDVLFEYDTPITFDAIAVFPYERYFGNYGKRISLNEVHVYID